jgi:hypothetical protein
LESYKHLFAKRVLANWLRVDEGWPLVDARPNRTDIHKGVYTEYPVCLDPHNHLVGLAPVWDESYDFYDLNRSVPTYEECIDLGLLPICIFDVAMLHKGEVRHVFEVVHKHHMTKAKRDYIERMHAERHYFDRHVIDADWILSQCGRPKKLRHLEHWSCV